MQNYIYMMDYYVIFDLDETLLDHKTAVRQALFDCAPVWLPELRIDILQEKFWFRLEKRYMAEFLAGEIPFSE